jgi:hypothetical protein
VPTMSAASGRALRLLVGPTAVNRSLHASN